MSSSSSRLSPTSSSSSSSSALSTESFDSSGSAVNIRHEMIAGSIAACVTRLFIAPFDVIKIRFQIQEAPINGAESADYTSVWQAIRRIYREEGVRAFWKGNMAAELMVVPYGAVSFYSYQKFKDAVRRLAPTRFAVPDYVTNLAAGSFAGFCATVSTYPLDLMRTRFAAQQEPKVYKTLVGATTAILKSEGVGGLYVGMWPTLFGIVPLMAIQFGCYEGMKTLIRRWNHSKESAAVSAQLNSHNSIAFWEQSACGFVAGIVSKFVTMPLDVIKKRFQVSGFQWESHRREHVSHHHHHHAPSHPSTFMHGTSTTSTPIGHTSAASFTSHTSILSSNSRSLQPPGPSPSPPPSLSPPPQHMRNVLSQPALANPNHLPASGSSLEHVLKRRRRPLTQPVSGHRPFTGVIDCARGIIIHEGWRGLFKGTVPSLIKAGPNSALIYVVYEQTMNALQNRYPTAEQIQSNNNNNNKSKVVV